MSLYPSLEDMKVDQMLREQLNRSSTATANVPHSVVSSAPPLPPNFNVTAIPASNHYMYPLLDEYMGLSLSSDEMSFLEESRKQVAITAPSQIAIPSAAGAMVAPLSGGTVGLKRAAITHGLREVTLCKDKDGKVGLRVKDINKGVFVVLVHVNSPASMVGLRFGDQILQINDEVVAGYSTDKVHNMIKNSPVNGIKIVVRDRPFERTITLHKDSTGHTGFSFKQGKINAIVKDSSAARNGLLIDHNLLEVNGQNVVGMNDKYIREIIDSGGNIITLTIMPSSVFEHMMKQMASSLVKKLMDHSIPDV